MVQKEELSRKFSGCKNCEGDIKESIEIAFDFSKYDLLMLQIQQITIFSPLQPIKCF